MTERKELKYQPRIVDSYPFYGGFAKKWVTDVQVGNPDLICTLPWMGLHLIEVKHRPDWRVGYEYVNPLAKIQGHVAGDFLKGGGLVFGLVITGGELNVMDTKIHRFDPRAKFVKLTSNGIPYIRGRGYNMRDFMENYDV